jgi:hypothetical protein
VLIYLAFVLLSHVEVVRKGHLAYYCKVGDKIFNVINPNLYANFIPGAPPNENGWNTTIALYFRSEHGSKIKNKTYRDSVNPERYMYRNMYELILLPSLFILALFLVTPGLGWKRGILSFLACILILYIFLSFHFSHIFENLILNEGKIGNTFWHKFVSIFGFKGLTEPLYIIALVSWAAFTFRPELLEKFK